MVLTSDDAVIRALQRQMSDPSAVRDQQRRRDSFVELLLDFADAEDDDALAPTASAFIPRSAPRGIDAMAGAAG